MNGKYFLGIIGVLVLLIMLGCTQQGFCGDGVCSPGESQTCPTDCAQAINGSVFVEVYYPWDVEGDVYLEYYTNSGVNYNFSQMYNSYISQVWGASGSKNLSVSLNDSQSVRIPVTRGQPVVIENPVQGEYYFTVRSTDYSYFGKSEKVLINESKDYFINLELKPSQPAVRLRAYDEDGKNLYGPAQITIYEVIEYYDKYGSGDWKIEERPVAGMEFSSENEINGLFYLWVPTNDFERNTRFKAVITKEEYNDAVIDYLSVYSKYQEQGITMFRSSPLKGNLMVNVVPGTGTSEADLVSLEGKTVQVCGGKEGLCKEEKISSNTIQLNDYYFGQYNIYQYSDYNSGDDSVVPVMILNKKIEISSSSGYDSVIALRGYTLNLGMVEVISGQYSIPESYIAPEKISLIKFCTYINGVGGCSEPSPSESTWADIWKINPLKVASSFYSEEGIEQANNTVYILKAKYNGVTQDFMFKIKQGANKVIMPFDSTKGNFSLVPVNGSIQVTPNGDWNGQKMNLMLQDVVMNGSTNFYEGKFSLIVNDMNAIMTRQLAPGQSLKQEFGGLFVEELIFDSVELDIASNMYYAKITEGKMVTLNGNNFLETDPLLKGLVGLWRFDEASGLVKSEVSSIDGNLPTLGVTRIQTDCKFGSCLKFNGDLNTGNVVSFGNRAELKVPSKTIAFWAKPSAVSGAKMLFSASSANYYLAFSGSQMYFSYHDATVTQRKTTISPVGTVKANEWHYYTFVFNVDGNTVKVMGYVDGIKKAVGFTGLLGYRSVYGPNFILGGYVPRSTSTTNNGYMYSGLMDETAFWNRALSDAEVKRLYYGN